MLRVAVDFCPEGKLACQNCDLPTTAAQSFRGQVASFHKRNWITPLIQVITNAMVSFPDATHRSEALLILQKLVSKLVDTSRFWILRNLIVECPYGNVAAILVDFVRNDTVHAWSSSNANLQSRELRRHFNPSIGYNSLIVFGIRSVSNDSHLLVVVRGTGSSC